MAVGMLEEVRPELMRPRQSQFSAGAQGVRRESRPREEIAGGAAEAVGERADDGGEEELHGGEDGAEEAEHLCGGGGVAVEKAFDETGQDGGDHAEGEHVEGDGEEDEGGGGAAALWRVRSPGRFE